MTELEQLRDKCAALQQQAEIHAMEARTANSIIAEIYQAVTGATGEPGNWNGARPVIERLAELRSQVEAQTVEHTKLVADTNDKIAELTRQRDEAMKDAEKWREHEAKKKALIERGFLRSPFRSDDAAIQGSKMP